MSRYAIAFLALILSVLTFAEAAPRGCPKPHHRIFKDTAHRSASLKRIVDKFNAALGGDDNGSEKGPIKGGRRSINWDADVVPFDMPGNFFKNVVTRGAKMIARGGEFRVSNPVPPNGDNRFSTINRRASKDFITFSPKRLFTPLKDNKVTVDFSIPGLNKDAVVKGFGAVYVDVDKRHVTQATYLDKRGCVIARQFVDPKNKGLSFLGVIFRKPVIAKVILKLGNTPIQGKGDFVVLDDFLYGEPARI